MDACPAYVKMMKSVFNETNYKLRRDGIIFLQKYFQNAELTELS